MESKVTIDRNEYNRLVDFEKKVTENNCVISIKYGGVRIFSLKKGMKKAAKRNKKLMKYFLHGSGKDHNHRRSLLESIERVRSANMVKIYLWKNGIIKNI